MKDLDTKQNNNGVEDATDTDASRRDFLKKYGKLAAITPVAMTMTLHSKKALASCTECGPDDFLGGSN